MNTGQENLFDFSIVYLTGSTPYYWIPVLLCGDGGSRRFDYSVSPTIFLIQTQQKLQITSPIPMRKGSGTVYSVSEIFLSRVIVGFSASSGMIHILLNMTAPLIRFCLQSDWTCRTVIPHLSATSCAVIYPFIPMISVLLSQKSLPLFQLLFFVCNRNSQFFFQQILRRHLG